MAVEVVTFGCRLNAYESEVIRREGEAVILEPLSPRAWPKGYWRRWGKASRDLDLVDPLPPGGKPVALDES